MSGEEILKTALHGLHVKAGAKMAPFAGYDMPIQYPLGIMQEHLHCRAKAGLFDVSHMGQITMRGKDIAKKLEKLVVGDIQELKPGQIKYSVFTNEAGGILDDLMITNNGDHFYLVVNAACKRADAAHLRAQLQDLEIMEHEDWALLAIQGPVAATIMARHIPGIDKMPFMTLTTTKLNGVEVRISRSGYTGEDGYEISVPNDQAAAMAEFLLREESLAWIGLGARDTLRLEAGLCLYGHDMNETTTPIEASLTWAIGKRRRVEGGFLGDKVILDQLKNGAHKKRVGFKPDGRAIAREGVEIHAVNDRKIGVVTSGGFAPTLQAPIAMGYVETQHAVMASKVDLMIRGAAHPATIVPMPFVPQRYYRGEKAA